MYRGFIKPFFDIFGAILVLIVCLPLLIIITTLLFFANQGKPFYFQIRPGKNGKLFRVIKFKTMNDKIDSSGKLLPDRMRLTRIGKFIRSYSIDELPQLFNVLSGKMSFIGPRPLLSEYLELYNDEQARRHEIKPGITGWAQVMGRNTISWQDRFNLDVWYVDHITFRHDLKIVRLTLIKALKKEGINASKDITMKPFVGNN